MSEIKQLRTCLVTRQKLPKKELLRIVSFRGSNVKYDLTSKAEGRGCYICPTEETLLKLVDKNASILARALKKPISPEEIEYLKKEFEDIKLQKDFRPAFKKNVYLKVSRSEFESKLKQSEASS